MSGPDAAWFVSAGRLETTQICSCTGFLAGSVDAIVSRAARAPKQLQMDMQKLAKETTSNFTFFAIFSMSLVDFASIPMAVGAPHLSFNTPGYP